MVCDDDDEDHDNDDDDEFTLSNVVYNILPFSHARNGCVYHCEYTQYMCMFMCTLF